MRPNNPSKRLRGRSRSKGGGGNPLSRSYESNGPDVKIRGSALQVADKYAQLARDAQSAGDRVMAENYFQHAEHYYRIVAAAYEQNGQQQPRQQRDDDRRYDERGNRGNEQPSINGFDGVEDEEDGLRRAIRVNGNHASGQRNDDQDGDEDDDRPQANHRNGANGSNGNGAHVAASEDDDEPASPAVTDLANAPQPEIEAAASESAPEAGEDTAEAAAAEGDEAEAPAKRTRKSTATKAKTPRTRRTTTTRTRTPRTRRTETNAEGGGQPAAETGDSN